MSRKTIHTLIGKFFRNDLPADVQRGFRHWLIKDANQQEKEEVMEEVWEATSSDADAETLADLEKMRKRIDAHESAKRKTLWRKLLGSAAIFLLPLVGAACMYMYIQQNHLLDDPVWTEYFVPNGKRKQLILSDGTEVWLNSGSVLIYTEQFRGNKRSLYLNGEGSFKVTEDKKRPFIVKTKYVDVEVLGTVFNVEAYSDSELVKVTLDEGQVKLDDNTGTNETMFLSPDEQAIYNPISGSLTKENIDADRVLQWKHGYLYFQSATFNYIVKTIERKFDVTINYETNKYLNRSFTMKFKPNEGITEVLEIMKEMVPGLSYKVKDDIIYIH